MSSDLNYKWEDLLDIDDSKLTLTSVLCPCNRHVRETITITSTQNTDGIIQVEEVEKNPVRIISGPVGIVQLAKIRKQSDIHEGGDDSAMGWREYVKANGGIVSGCLGDIKTFIKNGKLEQVVAIIMSCSLNALGDLKVTVKDLYGTLAGSIHYKVINKEGYGKEITVGSAIILANVSVFSPTHQCIILTLERKTWLRFSIRILYLDLYKFDEEALNFVLEEEARESRAHEEWLEKSKGGGALGALGVNKAITHHVIAIFLYPLRAVEAAFALEVDAIGALDLVEVKEVGALDLVEVKAVGALDLVEVEAVGALDLIVSLTVLVKLASFM
nr:hypothetical protein [Tanacetum cinerariifolium]